MARYLLFIQNIVIGGHEPLPPRQAVNGHHKELLNQEVAPIGHPRGVIRTLKTW